MSPEGQPNQDESGLFNIADLTQEALSEGESPDTLNPIEEKEYRAFKEIYIRRADIRNCFRKFWERNTLIPGFFESAAYVPEINGESVFREDKAESRRASPQTGLSNEYVPGSIENDVDVMDGRALKQHERLRYLRDKFRYYLQNGRDQIAADFLKKSMCGLKSEGERAELTTLFNGVLADYITFLINGRRNDAFVELFFSSVWLGRLKKKDLSGVKRERTEDRFFRSDIRKALILISVEEGLESGNKYRRYLDELGLYRAEVSGPKKPSAGKGL
jgi:hypothetical protein